jgi:alkanesulfonate monooxygenase SsuD/methylene tetrahydromethanopterin reductase-like flavin-dependent oxidoreductase (luciferase family)
MKSLKAEDLTALGKWDISQTAVGSAPPTQQETNMQAPVGLNIYSGLVGHTMPYMDQTVASFESIWMPDHVMYGAKNVAEGWSLMVYALARYPDKLCGHQVLCNSFRNPAHLAKMAATCQILSGGRFVMGIGAGWNEEEYLAYGWPFPRPKVRIEQLAEAIQILRAMWTATPVHFQGKHYQVVGAYCEPKPEPVPPVMVGGAGERFTLRVVAEHADWWNYIYQDAESYRQKQEVLKAHCRDVGRDYDEIVQVAASQVLIGESEAEVRRLQDDPEVRSVASNGVAGTPEQVTEQLLASLAQGARRINVSFADSPRSDGTLLFVERVLPHLVV